MAHKYAESRKRARLVWSRSEHGKAWSKNYMREYRKRPEVKKRAHEYYINKKIEKNNYSRPENDLLHSDNTELFSDYGKVSSSTS